jgi:hypothetical protein
MEQQPSQFTITTFVAVWGAVLGTLTFIWNLLKWRQERPQISACIEAVESLSRDNCYSGIRLKIRNRGGKKTTVENIFLYRRASWNEFGVRSVFMLFYRQPGWEQNVAGSRLKTAVLPAVLDINGVWEGSIPFEANDEDSEEELRQVERSRNLAEVLRIGKVRYSIVCSHTNARKTGSVRRVEF